MNSTVTHNSISLSDILSFYKEELGSDDANYVSLVAALHGSSKMEALIHVVLTTSLRLTGGLCGFYHP